MSHEFAGLTVDRSRTYEFKVSRCPEKHAGLGRVLINFKRRDKAKRFQIVRLMVPNGKQALAAVIGHYDSEDIIKMDYDLRTTLGLDEGEKSQIEVRRCGYWGTLYWYLTVPDPLVRVPAFLALISIAFGVFSIFLSLLLG